MDIDVIKLFSSYNTEVNGKMNEIIKTIKNEQWEKEFGGYFCSIKSLCNHIYIGDFNWLKRFSKLKTFKYINNEAFGIDTKFTETVISTIEDYINKRILMDKFINNFINEVEEGDLYKLLKYKDSKGNDHEKIFGGLIIHMFNHQTHHRGMISLYLEEMNIENDYSNLISIL